MEMPNINLLSITPIYIALLGLLFFPMTLRVGGLSDQKQYQYRRWR